VPRILGFVNVLSVTVSAIQNVASIMLAIVWNSSAVICIMLIPRVCLIQFADCVLCY